jgi:hypothetical protein
MEIPTGFIETEAHGFHIITRPVYHKVVVSLAARDPERALDEAAAVPGPAPGPPGPMEGRGARLEIPLPDGEILLLKKQRRGGLYGKFVGDIFKDQWRAVSDIALSETAWKKGVPVAQLAFALSAPAGVGRLASYRRAYVASVKVPGARSLMQWLAADTTETERRVAMETAAAAINRAHDRGFTHGDLNLGNILVVRSERGEYTACLIDLAHSTLGGTLVFEKRLDQLMRLYRSVEKWLPDDDLQRRLRHVTRFLRAYTQHEPGQVRRYVEASSRYGMSFFLHRLSWKAGRSGNLSPGRRA